jgi:putative methyltransferase (TIGR04325 family)
MNLSLKDIIPPIFYKLYGLLKPNLHGWFGNYSSWKEAQNACGSYDSEIIIDKVKGALHKVKNGEAAYERDGVLFDKANYSWPLVSGLLLSYSSKNKLNVLDFGGSLGSTYFQHKKILKHLSDVKWNIVEQAKFIEIGVKEFQTNELKFYYSVEECFLETTPNVLLLGSVLQYIEQPYELLSSLFSHHFEYIIIDRTPFDKTNKHKITAQKVHPNIYKASYPCHLFSELEFISFLKNSNYELIEQYGYDNELIKELYLQGFILKLKHDK